MNRLWHRGSSIFIAERLLRESSTSSTMLSARLLQRESSISIVTALSSPAPRGSSISIATILHRVCSISTSLPHILGFCVQSPFQGAEIIFTRFAESRLLNSAHCSPAPTQCKLSPNPPLPDRQFCSNREE